MNRYERDYPTHLQDEIPTRRDARDPYQDDLPLRQAAASALPSSRDREYTLSTGIVLGIFFALALICSVFFGFGYTLGRKSLQPTVAAEGSAAEGADPSTFSKFKPAAGSTSGTSSSTLATPVATPLAASTIATASTQRSTNTTTPSTDATKNTVAITTKNTELTAPPVRETTPPPAVAAPVATGGVTMVQIAAVSHPEDAEVLTAALKRRGYAVVARSETGDRLIHVQVGPFPTRKDAESMRQKLIGDGYNAILK